TRAKSPRLRARSLIGPSSMFNALSEEGRFANSLFGVLMPLFPHPGFRLLSNDLYQVADCDIEVDQVQAPVRSEVANNVASMIAGGIGVHGDFQIRCIFVRLAFCGQQAGNADPWCFDRPLRIDPGLWFGCTNDGAAIRRQVTV